MSPFKERLLDVLDRIAESQERLEIALAENARELHQLRVSVTSQISRNGVEIGQVRRRVMEHEVRIFNLETPEGPSGKAAE